MNKQRPHSTEQQAARRPTRTIRQKMVYLMALLVAAISLFIYLFFPAQFEQQAVETIAAKAASIAEMSAYTLGPALDFNNVDEVEEGLQAALQFEDALYAYVQNLSGDFIGSFLKDSTSTTTTVALSPEDGIGPLGEVYHVRRSITSNNQKLGYLYMGFSLQPLHTSMARSRLILAFVSLLVFLIGMGATYGISVFITQPLSEIVHDADRIAQGDLTHRTTVVSNDEVGRLGTSFNKMVDSLAAASKAQGTSEARFQAVIENATDIIGLVDPDGRIRYVSPSIEDIVGYTPEEITGKNIFEYVHADDQAMLSTGLRRGTSHPDTALTVETRWRHKEGSWRYLSCRGRSMMDHPGIGSFLFTARDITLNKQAEQELVTAKEKAEEMVQLKNTFLANMSHEIRTPLTGVLGYAQILREEVAEEHRELVETITYSGNRLLSTLNSVLDLAQLEAQSVQLDRTDVDLHHEAVEVVNLLKPLAQEGVIVEVTVPAQPVFATLDPDALQRILSNLVGNALKFTEKGRVSIEIDGDDHNACLHVRDTGTGISKDFLPHIFDEFKQESTGISRTHEGNGLGLTITKKLTELMDGTISIESIKDLGSVFTLTFPRITPAAIRPAPKLAVARAAGRPAVQKQSMATTHVLVVEDNQVTQKIIEHMLMPHYNVESVANSKEALKTALIKQFDAILMDINLGPGKDGVETMRDLRTDPSYHAVPVIAVTAYAMPGDAKRYLDEGFNDYLSKPFKRDRLLEKLAKNLRNQAEA